MKQKKKTPVLFRVTDTLSLQFLLFHVWWMYCQFSWGRVHPRYPNMAYQLCVFVEASCWVHDISGCLQSHPISKLRLEFQTKPCYKAGFSERARHSYNVEISGSFLSTLFNPLSDRHNCKVVFTIISVTLVSEGEMKKREGRCMMDSNKTGPQTAINSDHFFAWKGCVHSTQTLCSLQNGWGDILGDFPSSYLNLRLKCACGNQASI